MGLPPLFTGGRATFELHFQPPAGNEVLKEFQALEKKLVRGCICEIELPPGGTLVTGKPREELGQLEGRAYKPSTPIRRHSDPTKDRAKVEWVVRVPQGSTVKLLARHERAGVVRTELTLP
ncbi:MAG: hypothetical protein V7L27_27680 [Nostoc sp.]|uniref:hypothetical protein n=1 Tax=Nostoc sp. TaxID=1180 RepID=UPI002FFC5C45